MEIRKFRKCLRWMKEHGFDNKGKLPKYVKGSKAKKAKKKRRK